MSIKIASVLQWIRSNLITVIMALVLLDGIDGIEYLAGGVYTHILGQGINAFFLCHLSHGEDLGDGLNGHFRFDVAHAVDLAVHRHNNKTKNTKGGLGWLY